MPVRCEGRHFSRSVANDHRSSVLGRFGHHTDDGSRVYLHEPKATSGK